MSSRRGRNSGKNKNSNEEDFETFVRDSLSKLIDGQGRLEQRFDKLEKKVNDNTKRIVEVEESLGFQDTRITDIELHDSTTDASIAEHNEQISVMQVSIDALESEVNRLERYTRSFNLRFINVEESERENCREVLGKLLQDTFGIDGSCIENAHRTGKARDSGPRHLIARFHSRVTRNEIIRRERTADVRPPFHVVDDLTQADLTEKRRVNPAMKILYDQSKKPRFQAGKVYVGGRPVKPNTIENLLQEAAANNVQ